MPPELFCASCRTPAHPDDRFCRHCGASVARPVMTEHTTRRIVVILFVDIVGWTTLAERLDPEVLRGILTRYYTACADAIIEHGGSIEKYVGDAVMAVFGVTVSHEDDALRAARAARRILAAVAEISTGIGNDVDLRVHCGIGSGEVAVAVTPGAQLRMAGDAVNAASRLQSVAPAGEVYVDADVATLIRAEYEIERLPPLQLKGKSQAVRAWRLGPAASAPAPAVHTPMIGRLRELHRLEECRQWAFTGPDCVRVDVVGAAGIGKSRLVTEFLATRPVREATVLYGRCQPYGRDITYLPLVSMLADVPGWPTLTGVLDHDDADRQALRCLTTLSGDTAEISWSFARLLKAFARDRPLVLVWDDLQWAEPNLHRLVHDLEQNLNGMPVLLVCCGRTDAETDWTDSRTAAERVHVDRLSRMETAELITALTETVEVAAQADAMSHVLESCDGNPLFATVMVEMVMECGESTSPPPTVSALLRTRLDSLDETERLVLQFAATCGQVIDRRQIEALADGTEPGVPGPELEVALLGLIRRRLLVPTGAGRYRFDQMLMLDTAYAMATKSDRARWHAILAGSAPRLEEEPTARMLQSTLYHAEAACLLLRELRPDDPRQYELARHAAALLAAEGAVALHRNDLDASINLLERALALLHPDQDSDGGFEALTIRLSDAFLARGDSGQALSVLSATDVSGATARCRRAIGLQRATLLLRLGSAEQPGPDEIDRQRADLDADPGDDLSWCLLHQLRGHVALARGRFGEAEQALAGALERAVAGGDRYTEDRLHAALCELTQWSPTPVPVALARSMQVATRFAADRLLLVPVQLAQARLYALLGDRATAEERLDRALDTTRQLRAEQFEIALIEARATILSLDGDARAAGDAFAHAARRSEAHGYVSAAHTARVYAAREALAGGDDAPARVIVAAEPASTDPYATVWTDLLRAQLRCRDGDHRTGATDAIQVATTLEADDPCLHGSAWAVAARLAAAAGDLTVAADAVTRAIAHYRDKGAVSLVESIRRWATATGLPDASDTENR